MSSIFPIREKVSLDRDPEPRLVDLDEETADEVFEALASGTTRKIFLELHSQPQTASDLAEVTDTSVQNVQYHLEKLDSVDLVEVVDTWYSERGSEMKVYAPQDESLVLFAGRDKQSAFRRLLDRFAGVFALLVPPSILAGWLANQRDTGVEDGIRGEYAVADDDAPEDETFTATTDDAVADDDTVDDAVDQEAVDDDEPAEEDIGAQTADDGEEPDDSPDPEETPVPEEEAEPEPDGTPTPEDDLDTEATTSTEFESDTVEIVVSNQTEAAELAARENETVYLALESSSRSDIMGVDPNVALAFFLGGLVVYSAFVLRKRVIK